MISARQSWVIGGLVVSALILAHPAGAIAAARLYLDPPSATITSGAQTSLKLMIDTSNQAVLGADAKITFPKAMVEIVSITPGTFFSGIDKVINSLAGTAEIHGYISSSDTDDTKVGAGTVATLAVKGIAPGSASLAIACSSGVTTDANIADENGDDIITCSAVTGTTLTITQSTGAGGVVASTPTPTPSSLPQAGVATPLIGVLAIGTFFLGGGMILVVKERNRL